MKIELIRKSRKYDFYKITDDFGAIAWNILSKGSPKPDDGYRSREWIEWKIGERFDGPVHRTKRRKDRG